MKCLAWSLRLIASVILFQTLVFKFSGAPESVYVFDRLGLGAIGVIAGAILSHLFILGIEVQGDGGLLFSLTILVIITSALNVVLTKEKLKILNIQI